MRIWGYFNEWHILLISLPHTQVSDDDSYVSDISDNVSEDNLSNDIENERQTLGKFNVVLCLFLFLGIFFFSSLTRNNLILQVLRCKQPAIFCYSLSLVLNSTLWLI